MLAYVIAIACSGCGPSALSPPQTETATVSATSEYIMGKVFENIARNSALRGVLIHYNKSLVTEDLRQDTENPTVSKTELFWISGKGGGATQFLIEENGKPLKNAKEKPNRIDLDMALNGRYKYTLAANPLLMGTDGNRLYYIIDFTPIETPPDARDGEDPNTVAVLNRISGTIVIDSELWYIVRMEGRLPQPFKHKLIATIAEFTVLVEQQVVVAPGGINIFLPRRIETVLHHWQPFSETHKRETSTYYNIQFFTSPQ